jgi:hypothetical protein
MLYLVNKMMGYQMDDWVQLMAGVMGISVYNDTHPASYAVFIRAPYNAQPKFYLS